MDEGEGRTLRNGRAIIRFSLSICLSRISTSNSTEMYFYSSKTYYCVTEHCLLSHSESKTTVNLIAERYKVTAFWHRIVTSKTCVYISIVNYKTRHLSHRKWLRVEF